LDKIQPFLSTSWMISSIVCSVAMRGPPKNDGAASNLPRRLRD
jgi:hypothetical protein